MQPTLFRLINIRSGETMAIVELPGDCTVDKDGNPSLLGEIVNEQNMTLKVQYGSDYTLDPLDDPMAVALQDLYNAYMSLTKEPTRYLTELTTKQDRVIGYVERLFENRLERVALNTKEDVANYVAWLRGKAPKDYQLPLIYRKALGEHGGFIPDYVKQEDESA